MRESLTVAPFMAEHGEMDQAGYNYAYFDQHVAAGTDSEDEAAFRASFRAGEQAEDFSLVRLDDGAPVRLSDLWRSKPLVMEFGSFT
jgi:nicotinic acid phosphoribosyltransferase